jgi:hypothetical protein
VDILGDENSTQVKFLADKKEVLNIVDYPRDIPDSWFRDGTGKLAEMNRSLFRAWERCLARGVQWPSAAEIFNPKQEWTDTVLQATKLTKELTPTASVPVIHEEEENFI